MRKVKSVAVVLLLIYATAGTISVSFPADATVFQIIDITTDGNPPTLNYDIPDISGSNIAWQSGGASQEIFFYDGANISQLTNNSLADFAPRVSGSNVVWVGDDGNDFEIFFYNGSNVIQLTNNTVKDVRPRISGSNVVWESGTGTNMEFMFFYGSTVSNISNNSVVDSIPEISGSNVVWISDKEVVLFEERLLHH